MGQISFSQVFPQPPAPQIRAEFTDIYDATIAFGDVDQDGDLDVMIAGTRPVYTPLNYNDSAQIYINDGNGNYTKDQKNTFGEFSYSDIEFSDVDGDLDQDLVICGISMTQSQSITKLFLNDGAGRFEQQTNVPFDSVYNGDLAFEDIDNDEDQDLLITGWDNKGAFIANLYLNDGEGNFIQQEDTVLFAVDRSAVAFEDYDLDGDPDLVITGNKYGQRYTDFYLNDGEGNFSVKDDTIVRDISNGDIIFEDFDGDGDPDLIVRGFDDLAQYSTELYLNDGNGDYIKSDNSGLPDPSIIQTKIAAADLDNDQDIDLFLSDRSSSSVIYFNDGSGNFTAQPDEIDLFADVNAAVFADIDQDNDVDLMVNYSVLTDLYINDSNGQFKKVIESAFEPIYQGSIAYADIDTDQDEDVYLTGRGFPYNEAGLYLNDGSGAFTNLPGIPFDTIYEGVPLFGDIDGDQDPDLLLAGINPSNENITKLYLNNGNHNFTLFDDTTFSTNSYNMGKFTDVDMDQDQDLILLGESYNGFADLFINDGDGNFTHSEGLTLENLDTRMSSFDIADADNDNDPDFIITGTNTSTGEYETRLFINNGSGVYSPDETNSFGGVRTGHVRFSDVNHDTNQDLLITGYITGGMLNEVHYNDGTGTFTLADTSYLPPAGYLAIECADFDNKNGEDLLVSSQDVLGDGSFSTKILLNDGNGKYAEISGLPFENIFGNTLVTPDIDGDGDRDIIFSGRTESGKFVTNLYRNNLIVTNLPPVFHSKAQTTFPENVSDSILDIDATDGNGGTFDTGLLYQLSGGADLALFQLEPESGLLSFIVPMDFENPLDDNQDNSYQLEVTVEDSSLSAAMEITIIIENVNEPPFVVTEIPDLTLNEGFFMDTVMLSGVFSDPENDPLTYGASATAPAVLKTTVSEDMVIIEEVSSGTSVVEVSAADGSGLLETTAFDVNIEEATAAALSRQGIRIYPNPATDRIRVETPQAASLHLYDLQGRLQFTTPSNQWIDVSSLENGNYILIIKMQETKVKTSISIL